MKPQNAPGVRFFSGLPGGFCSLHAMRFYRFSPLARTVSAYQAALSFGMRAPVT